MDNLRVIAGAFKGKRLIAPPGLATRPLPDRIKQSLFDWLGQAMDGKRVVDCCAGSGAFACEAVSRGAAEVIAIEPGNHALPALRANARALGNPTTLTIVAQPFQAALPRLHEIDLLFADPPFPWFAEEPDTIATLLRLGSRCLRRDGRLVIRGERGSDLPLVAGVREVERRFYGRSWIAILEAVAIAPVQRPLSGRVPTPSRIDPMDGDDQDDDEDEDEDDDDLDDDEDDDDEAEDPDDDDDDDEL